MGPHSLPILEGFRDKVEDTQNGMLDTSIKILDHSEVLFHRTSGIRSSQTLFTILQRYTSFLHI